MVILTSCSTASRRQPAPLWYQQPPKHTAQYLYFIGDSTNQPDESTAREFAIQKALSALSQYCGAVIQTHFQSAESERNGKYNQMVSLTVDIAGEELTIREALVEQAMVRRGLNEDFDGFAMIRWPQQQYRAVLRRQQARARRGLEVYLQAQSHLAAHRLPEAKAKLDEAATLISSLRTEIALSHKKITHTGLLNDALNSLETRIIAIEGARQGVVAVGLACTEKRSSVLCPRHRIGHVREQVVSQGLEVTPTPVTPLLVQKLTKTSSSSVRPTLRDARYLLAVTYNSELAGEEDGFVFARCSARAALFDTDKGHIVDTAQVRPQKGGHIHFAGASAKGCDEAETNLTDWMRQVLSNLNPTNRATTTLP